MKTRTLVSAAALGLCTLLFLPAPAPLRAATFTFSDPNCSDFAMSQPSPGNFQLTCNLVSTPVCQLQSSSLNPAVNTQITLTASCLGGPSSWQFSGTAAACATNSATCNDTRASVGPVTYTVTGSNGAGTGPAASVTVNWGVAAPLTAPSGCSLSANPPTLGAGGGATTLTVSCSGGGAPTSYAWTGGGVQPSTGTPSQAVNITKTTSFSVTASNGAGNGNVASMSVSVAGTSGAPDFCGQYGNVTILDLAWGKGQQVVSGGSGGSFAANGILVVRFTVPAGFASASGAKGTLSYAEYAGPATYRQVSLSPLACDFRGVANVSSDRYKTDPTGTNYPFSWTTSNGGTAYFTVTGTSLGTPQLVAGQTYYFNLRNYSPYLNGGAGAISCTVGTCNAIVQLNTP